MLDFPPITSHAVYTLHNRAGSRAVLSDVGCALMALHIAGKNGETTDVVLGYDLPVQYFDDPYFMGVVVGRVAGRVADGALGQQGPQLHGGEWGLGRQRWQLAGQENDRIRFRYVSPNGEGGHLGQVVFGVDYQLTDSNEFVVRYTAEADCETVVSPTQHSYFNLAGHDAGSILGHEVRIDAARFVPVDEALMPLGSAAVEGGAMDLRRPRVLRQGLAVQDEQLEAAGGYDHSWELAARGDWRSSPAAVAREPCSGRELAVYTDRPAVHFYTGNMLAAAVPGKDGACYGPRHGFCLETQHLPTRRFDRTAAAVRVAPGAAYESETRFAFRGY